MTTARDLVTDALYKITAYGQGEAISNADAQLGLRTLIRMVDSWSNDDITVHTQAEQTIALVATQSAYSTTLLGFRPLSLGYFYCRDGNNVSYPGEVIDAEKYAAIAYKPGQGIPNRCWFDPGWPNSTLNFYPTPIGGLTAVLGAPALLQTITSLDTVLSFPPGYERALVFGLAIDLAPDFSVEPSAAIVDIAAKARGALGRTNLTLEEADLSGIPSSVAGGHWNWLSGETN